MNEPYFSGIRVGDKVWSSLFGYGTVMAIYPNYQEFQVAPYDSSERWLYKFEGNSAMHTNSPQCCWWDKPEIIPTPRPKRKVMKRDKYWLAWLKNKESGVMFPAIHLYVKPLDMSDLEEHLELLGDPIEITSPEYEGEE